MSTSLSTQVSTCKIIPTYSPSQQNSSLKTVTQFNFFIFFLEIVNYEFDRIDLLCLAISSAFGVWYLWKKVSYVIFVLINPFSAKDVLIDFTLSNARRFYSSKGNPLALKGLKNYLP